MSSYCVPIMGKELSLSLPDSWTVRSFGIDRPGMSSSQIWEAFANPIGTARLRDLARGKKTAALIVDDTSRPLRAAHFMPMLLEELAAGGITADNIVIVAGRGTHRPMNGPDFRIKVGDEAVDRIKVMNHSLYEHVVFMGTTSRGTPVHICREVAQADLRIGIGGIIPHPGAGYGGGAKIVLPGISSMETIAYNHAIAWPAPKIGEVENDFRHDLEEVARIARLDAIVNPVINGKLEPVGLFVGDLVAAHRAGCRLGDEVYFIKDAPMDVDGAIISGYPMDREFNQSIKALAPGAGMHSVKDGGAILFLSMAVDGGGYHALNYRAGRVGNFKEKTRKQLGERKLVVYSPNVGPREVYERLPEEVGLHKSLDQAVAAFVAVLPSSATVNLFPHGGISLLAKT